MNYDMMMGLGFSEDELTDFHKSQFEPFQVDWRNREKQMQNSMDERNQISDTMQRQERTRQLQKYGNQLEQSMMGLGNTMQDMSLQTDIFGWRL